MDGKGDAFIIDRELDVRDMQVQETVERIKRALSGVRPDGYMLVYISDYSAIEDIAQAVLEKQAIVESVLKKNENDWILMVKNAVPVAQAG